MDNEKIITVKDLDLYYGDHKALNGINMDIERNSITAFIGPSGCGKSTFLRTLNRMNDLIPNVKIEGKVIYNDKNIYDKNVDIYNLRKEKGFSQEYMAEQINVSRQTISNWELGETSPNPEQLLLLSKTLETSVDNLLDNDMIFKDKNEKNNYIYLGIMVVCGSIAGIWTFTANRFKLIEIVLIIIGGVAIGYGIGLIIDGVLKKIEWKNSINKDDAPKTLKKKL